MRCCWRNLNITCSMSSSNKSSVLNLQVYVLVILLGHTVYSSSAIDVHQSHFCLSKASACDVGALLNLQRLVYILFSCILCNLFSCSSIYYLDICLWPMFILISIIFICLWNGMLCIKEEYISKTFLYIYTHLQYLSCFFHNWQELQLYSSIP